MVALHTLDYTVVPESHICYTGRGHRQFNLWTVYSCHYWVHKLCPLYILHREKWFKCKHDTAYTLPSRGGEQLSL